MFSWELFIINVAREKLSDERDHFIGLFFERKVAGVEQMELRLRQVTQIWRGTIGRENLVILAPENERWWLTLAEEGLELRVAPWLCA